LVQILCLLHGIKFNALDKLIHTPMNKIHHYFFLIATLLILGACASDKAIYRGQTANGSPHGIGKKFWPDGSKYEGQWANGQMSGKGVLSFKDGRNYDGSFENSKLHGQGKMQYPDGSSYEGSWANGERSGQGKMKFADQSQYSGNWSANVQSGFGNQDYNSGNSYSGNFTAGQRHGDGAAVAYYHGDASNWCIDNCSQTSPQFAVVSGNFVSGNAETVTAAPCGTSQDKCKAMLAPALAAIVKERARILAEAQRERERLAAEAEKARQRKEAALLAEQQRKEEARLALLNTGTASQVYMHADKLESERDYVQASEAYRIVVSRFPESSFAAASMTRLGAMRDKRDQQEAEQRRLALEAEQRRNDEAKRQSEAAERQAERETAAAQRQADQNAAANQQRKASTGAACVEIAKALCDRTTSGFANSICKASAGIGCN